MTMDKREKERKRKVREALDELIITGRQRRNMSQQLQELLSDVANAVATELATGEQLIVRGVVYRVVEVRTWLDNTPFLAILDYPEGEGGPARRRVLSSKGKPDETIHLHGDYNCPVRVASREQFLAFANHLPEVLGGFRQAQEAAINQIKVSFEKLRALAEGGGE